MILELKDITHYYGSKLILQNINFSIEPRERLGIVGYNGCGKTTLLRIMTGEMNSSFGSIRSKEGIIIGYQKQAAGLNNNNTVLEEMKTTSGVDKILKRIKELEPLLGSNDELMQEYEILSARFEAIGGYELDYRIRKILFGMSFNEDSFTKKVGVLSGGEKTRLAFSKLLISNPDILVLDEPTNHLDSNTLEWLEEYLISYSGAVVAVSHDRFFLDRVMTWIVEIINNKAYMYKGNYSKFLELREFEEQRRQKDYAQQMEKAEKYKTFAERNIVRASTSNMAKSRLKMLGRLDTKKPESLEHEKVRFEIYISNEPFQEVLKLNDVHIKIKDRSLVEDLNYTLLRSERLAIVGPNGSGKTTLLNVIDERQRPEKGTVKLGGGVKKAFLEQNLLGTNTESPIEYIWNRYKSMTHLQVRNLLASVGFQGEEVFLFGSELSGGELARLHMARISLERPNLLILDEPTNHLDIYSKEILTNALEQYKGTMIVVTHDRYLLMRLNSKILLLDGRGGTRFFEDFISYRAYLDSLKENSLSKETGNESSYESGPISQKEMRRQRATMRQRVSQLEELIEHCERRIEILENELIDPEIASDHLRIEEIYLELEEHKKTLAETSDEWLRIIAKENDE